MMDQNSWFIVRFYLQPLFYNPVDLETWWLCWW